MRDDGRIPLVDPTLSIQFDLDKYTHDLDDKLVFGNLRNELNAEAGLGWYACVILFDGRGAFIPATPQVEDPGPEKRDYLLKIIDLFNKEVAYGGAWVGCWDTEPDKWQALWLDMDGDLQFTLYDQMAWVRMKKTKFDSHVANAIAAWRRWAQVMKEIRPRREQQVALARGERLDLKKLNPVGSA